MKIKGESAWELLLEGLCRISVEHVEQDQRLNFYSVRVRDLERSLLADSASLGKFVGNRDLGAALSNGDEKLVEQLKEVSGRLIQGLRAALVESETKGQAGKWQLPSQHCLQLWRCAALILQNSTYQPLLLISVFSSLPPTASHSALPPC